MAIEQAFKATIELDFNYIATDNSYTETRSILPERISYLVIDHEYENVNILPIIYISLRVSSSMYSDIMNTVDTSKFHLKITKQNALSNTSVTSVVVDDIFSYITSSTNANYTAGLNTNASDNSSYMGITVGLVSSTATNILRTSFNGVYKNTSMSKLIQLAIKDIKPIIYEPITYDKEYTSILIPPMSSIYKYLTYLFNKDPFYDSMFTLYMDFNTTYLISNHAVAVSANDGKPTDVYLYIKDYTATEAFKEGFSIQNGAYTIYVNASNTNVVVNNASEKVANNLIGYSDDGDTQNLNVTANNSQDNTTKTTYIRSRNVAAIKNQIQSEAVTLSIVKQNLDPDIFTPNKLYHVSNYTEYDKYDGNYILAGKKEVYTQTAGKGSFIITTHITLKYTTDEEIAGAISDNTPVGRKTSSGTYSLKRVSSTKKSSSKSTKASRKKK